MGHDMTTLKLLIKIKIIFLRCSEIFGNLFNGQYTRNKYVKDTTIAETTATNFKSKTLKTAHENKVIAIRRHYMLDCYMSIIALQPRLKMTSSWGQLFIQMEIN